MSKSKAYRSTEVKHVQLEDVLAKASSGPVIVGVDVGKFEAFAVVRFQDGSFERPLKTTLDEILASAGSSCGAEQNAHDVKAVQDYAQAALAGLREAKACDVVPATFLPP